MPRRQYNSLESEEDQVQAEVPGPFNGTKFLTLRYRKWFERMVWHATKVMVDVSREDISGKFNPNHFVHHPFKHCRHDTYNARPQESDIILSHYLGTWEQYSYKDDARLHSTQWSFMKDDKKYMHLSRKKQYEDDLHRLWLKGFVQNVGAVEAQRLLKDVGKLEPRAEKPQAES
jgi:hypothetical protein